MKYAIYDKAADGYLTKMEFEVGYSEHTQFECGYNEYITDAKLLDTPKEAADVIVRIESFKFMDKGRFVMHSFDDTLKDQYIISKAENPTKVVDNITVDLDGNINVKYGTMAWHWHTDSLEYAIVRMNALQKAKDSRYTAWCNTFDIYKVITVIDEKSCTHYQFIKVTEEGLAKYAKEEVNPLNKRIEELELANYNLGEMKTLAEGCANRLQEENDNLKTKVETIKKEASNWKQLYANADGERNALKNVIDNIYDDLHSDDMCKDLKNTYDYIHSFSELRNIKIHNDDDDTGMPIYITANVEFRCIINKIIAIIESRELNQSVAFASSEEVKQVKSLANDIINICEFADDKEVTLNKFSQLYEAVNGPHDDDDVIMYAFKGVLEIFSSLEDHIRGIIDESVGWKLRAEAAIRNYTRCNGALGEWKRKCEAKDTDYEMLKNKLQACEVTLDSTHDLLIKTTKERDRALERAEKFKGIANSVYGMTIPGRYCGKQLMADILSGKKIPISKDKYDDLVECVNNINITYDILKCADFTMNKPLWFDGIINRIKNLTE